MLKLPIFFPFQIKYKIKLEFGFDKVKPWNGL